jgi:alpha-amylase
MVNRCKTVNVDVYIDAVINHMTAGSGTGRNGSAYSKYSYSVPYSQSDFHSQCSIYNYQDAANVQNCQLVGLADLDTGSVIVQQKIADYLIALSRIGVAGFRIDAAKHINALELNEIISRVNLTLQSESIAAPYVFAEVIDYGGEAVRASDYFGLGYDSGGRADITEFKFRGVSDKFLGTGAQKPYQLNPHGLPGNQFSPAAWGLMPSDKAVVFLENHDTQRSGGISYRDGALYRLANIWMLAQPYGYPSVMSSYAFDRTTQAGRDAGPPAIGPGCASSLESVVAGEWVCEHRDPAIANMIVFRRAVAGTEQMNWWDNGASAIAFSRGDQGFVAINAGNLSVTNRFITGLASGTYCDVLSGGLLLGTCKGNSVTVGLDSAATITLQSKTGLVLQAGVSIR